MACQSERRQFVNYSERRQSIKQGDRKAFRMVLKRSVVVRLIDVNPCTL